MRAARLVAPGRVELDVVEIPEPQRGQTLVRMHAASICGSDVHVVFDGFHPDELPSRPGYPGHEGVGEVVASPSGALREGEIVLTVPVPAEAGCLADYQLVSDGSLIPLPADGDRGRLLLAQQLGTTIYAFRRFWSGPGARVATVLGAGSVGLFFLQQVRQAGFEHVVVSDREPGRLEVARELGATVTVLAPDESAVEATLDLSAGAGADLVIEAAGYDVCRAQAVEAVRANGRIGLFGFPERKGSAPFPIEAAFRKTPSIEWSSGTQTEPGLRSFREALEAIHAQRIEVDYCLSPRFPLERSAEALQLARERGRGAVKVGIDHLAGG